MKKKLISVLTLLTMCLTAFAVSATPAEWMPDKQVSPIKVDGELAYQITLKANIGQENAKAPVICRVVKATDGFVGLSDSKIIYMDQMTADAMGNASITFYIAKRDGIDPYGDFKANFRVMNGETSKDVPFTLLKETEVESVISSMLAPDANITQILQDNQNGLNINLTYFDKLKDTSGVLAEVKAKQSEINAYNVVEIVEKKTILDYIKTATDVADIANLLDTYEGKHLELSQQKWENIYNTYLTMETAPKTKAMELLQSYAPATIEEITEDFNQSIIFAAIKVMDKIALDEVITKNVDLLGISEYKDLGLSERTEFLGELQVAPLTDLSSVWDVYDAWKNPPQEGGGGGAAIQSPTQGSAGAGGTGAVGAFGADAEMVKDEPPETLDLAISFLDLKDVSWAETAIRHLAFMEIVNGKEPRKFYPNDSVTREEFIKMIVGAFNLHDETATCSFTDVPKEHWAYPYVASAYNKGLILGVTETEFGVGQNITREDMATLLYRMLVKLNKAERVKELTNKFEDMDEVSSYAEYGVLMLYNMGYVQGDNGNFYPKNTATRAEAAQMLYNIMQGNKFEVVQEEGGSAE